MIVVIVDLLIIKGLENLSHDFVVEFDRLLKFGDTLHQLYKEHGLCVFFTFFGNENRFTHQRNSVRSIQVGCFPERI